MKKFLTILFSVCFAFGLVAQEPTQADLVIKMNAAQRDGDYLGALVAATAILKQKQQSPYS